MPRNRKTKGPPKKMVQFYILHGPMIYAIIIINSYDLYVLPKAFWPAQFQRLAAVAALVTTSY